MSRPQTACSLLILALERGKKIFSKSYTKGGFQALLLIVTFKNEIIGLIYPALPFTTSHAVEVILLWAKTRKETISDIAPCSGSKIPWRKTGQGLSRNHSWYSFTFQVLLTQERRYLLEINLQKLETVRLH